MYSVVSILIKLADVQGSMYILYVFSLEGEKMSLIVGVHIKWVSILCRLLQSRIQSSVYQNQPLD